ncbi:MAG: undecaprenyldiphospho-muramoylpentapeptide beta-N-acetylglucosaminyltransferase [Firmicutes bacterium]|nr:undecaprenyldiphospho-muramoylpentapeptide beta-N-acetylglucosaminyltransferase [Bacillota bacterium]
MRVLFAGGGTGGHIYPALALARYLRRQEKAEVLFVGTERGMEKEIVPQAGFALETIPVIGLERRLSLRLVRTALLAAKGVREARKILAAFRPDVVVGTGGYVAGPVVLAARLARIPTIIHEQNAIPGLTNIWLSRLANRVCLSLAGSEQYFPRPEKTILTGNPRASEAVQAAADGSTVLQPQLAPGRPVLLCVGGSHGAAKLNEVFSGCLELILTACEAQIVYITGPKYYEPIKKQTELIRRRFADRLHILPYHRQLPRLLAQTDLVISRAGATTLAEITAIGVPAVLIPSPNVTNNHQEYNARIMAEKGAALIIREQELSVAGLATRLVELLLNQKRLQEMARASKALGMPEAAAKMAKIIYELAHK